MPLASSTCSVTKLLAEMNSCFLQRKDRKEMKAILASVCLLTMVSMVFAAPPVAKTPAAVDEVVYARPFTLSESFRYDWCNAPFQVSEGTILVLKVQTNLVIPRRSEVSSCTSASVAMLNQGDKSGHRSRSSREVSTRPGLVRHAGTPLPRHPGQSKLRRLADQAGIKPPRPRRLRSRPTTAPRGNGGRDHPSATSTPEWSTNTAAGKSRLET